MLRRSFGDASLSFLETSTQGLKQSGPRCGSGGEAPGKMTGELNHLTGEEPPRAGSICSSHGVSFNGGYLSISPLTSIAKTWSNEGWLRIKE